MIMIIIRDAKEDIRLIRINHAYGTKYVLRTMVGTTE